MKNNVSEHVVMDLYAAAGSGDNDLVLKLVNEGADVNLGDTWTGRPSGPGNSF